MKKLLIFLIIGMFLISFTSALDIDNVKSYDEKTQTVTITNSFGFGEDLATIKLNTPIIYKVGLGYQKVAEFQITNLANYENAIQEIRFYDTNNVNKEITRSFDYKVKIKRIIPTPTYNSKGNITGYENVEIEDWIPLEKTTFDKNEVITIGVFTDVKNGDRIEWIPKVYGRYIEEWAVWTADLNTNLIAYYDFNDTTGDVFDISKSSKNATNNGATRGVTGILGNAFNFSALESDYVVSKTAIGINGANPRSFSFWINGGTADTQYFMTTGSNSSGADFGLGRLADGTIYFHGNGAGDFSTSEKILSSGWQHLVVTYNGTTVRVYINGTLANGGEVAKTLNTGSSTLNIATKPDFANNFNGSMDEIGVWNRTLTSTEVTQLYNSGLGLEYKFNFIKLNSPTNLTNTISRTITFNCTPSNITGIINNVSLVIDGAIDQTNTSGIGGDYIFSKTFSSYGTYKWTCSGYFGGTYSTGENNTLTISNVQENAEVYSSSVTEGTNTLFALNVTLASGLQLSTANLIYDSTSYSGTFTKSGDIYYITKTLTIPTITSDTNKTFNWSLTLDSGYVYNSTKHNQTVLNLGIDNCSTNTNFLYNFTIVDEESQVKLTNTTIKVDLQIYSYVTRTLLQNYSTINYTNPFAICSSTNLSGSQFNLDAQIQYTSNDSSSSFANELYHIQNATINESLMNRNITLYNINSSNSQTFKLIFKDSAFIPVQDALIYVYRKYINEGVFKIVEIPKTDGNGETIANLELNDVIYNFIIIKNGVTLALFSNVMAVCQNPLVSSCEINFNAYATTLTIPDYETYGDLNYTLGYNNNTREISSTFVVPSGESSNVRLEVYTFDALSTSVCNDSLTSSTGSLSCVVPNTFGNATVIAKLSKDGTKVAQGTLKLDQKPFDLYGVSLGLICLFVMITLIGAGISDNPVYTAIFLVVGVILLFALNLVESEGFIGKYATILWFILVIIIIVIKGARRN